jgi:hypothetical protein
MEKNLSLSICIQSLMLMVPESIWYSPEVNNPWKSGGIAA